MKKKNLNTKLIAIVLCPILITMTFGFIFCNFNGGAMVKPNNFTDLGLKNSGLVNITLFEDDFESGLSEWSPPTGLWVMTNATSAWSNSSSAPSNTSHSFEHSMWYGQESTGDYNTGAQTMGNLTSEPFNLSSCTQASLEFYQWRAGEVGDHSFVYISTNGTDWDELYDLNTDISLWQQKIIDISTYCGNSSVTVRFYFETDDATYNNYRGWLIDDVKITGLEDDTVDPVVTDTPSDLIVEYGYTEQSLSWTATDKYPDTYTIDLQGTGIVTGPIAWENNTEVIFDIPDDFALGDYIYTINFTDKGNNDITDNVTFTVEDTTSPIITNAPSNFSVDIGYTEQTISWTATDPHPFNYTIVNGTGIIVQGPTNWTSGIAVTYNITDGFGLGDYEYMVNFTDTQGNTPTTHNVTLTVENPSNPNITDTPNDLTVEFGYTGKSLSWTATDNHPINYTIELDGEVKAGPTAWVSGNAITYTIPNGFAVGSYIYIVNFTDDKGNYTTDSVTFTVQDTTNPVITVTPNDLTLAFGYTGESLSWTATDPHPLNYTIELNGTGVVAGPTTWISGNAITFNVPDDLAPGVHIYNITFTDVYGNSFSDLVTVTVGEQQVSTPAAIPFGNFYLLFIAFGVIALIIYVKRKKY